MKLNVNVDHIATLRQARMTTEPDPVAIALLVESAGADGITVHLREDRRHIQDKDVYLLKKKLKTKLNLEMAAIPEIIEIALNLKPDWVTLVPEKRRELTTEGGLNILAKKNYLSKVVKKFKEKGIKVSFFIDPVKPQIKSAADLGADFIEIHTGRYADAKTEIQMKKEFERIKFAAKFGKKNGLNINAGHGLNYKNVSSIASIIEIEELSIGHSIIARASYVGIKSAVKEMLVLINK